MKVTKEMIEAGLDRVDWDAIRSGEADPEEAAAHAVRHALEAALAVAPEPVDHSELIAEAREACADRGFNGTYEAGLIRRLADALEGVAK